MLFEGASAETIDALARAVTNLANFLPYGGWALLVFIFARWVFLPMWQAWMSKSRG